MHPRQLHYLTTPNAGLPGPVCATSTLVLKRNNTAAIRDLGICTTADLNQLPALSTRLKEILDSLGLMDPQDTVFQFLFHLEPDADKGLRERHYRCDVRPVPGQGQLHYSLLFNDETDAVANIRRLKDIAKAK